MNDDGTWLVVGLGNPGPKYAGNRHNVGTMVVDELASRTGTKLTAHKARAAAATVRVGTLPGGAPGPGAVLAVPGSYMNESGGPVKALMRFFSVEADRLIVIHDELDIPAGDVRLKLYRGNVSVVGRRSPRSLYDEKIATFEADTVYNQRDAEGFIKLNALRLRLGAGR